MKNQNEHIESFRDFSNGIIQSLVPKGDAKYRYGSNDWQDSYSEDFGKKVFELLDILQSQIQKTLNEAKDNDLIDLSSLEKELRIEARKCNKLYSDTHRLTR